MEEPTQSFEKDSEIRPQQIYTTTDKIRYILGGLGLLIIFFILIASHFQGSEIETPPTPHKKKVKLEEFKDSTGKTLILQQRYSRERLFYTQGLFFFKNGLVESSGLYGDSYIHFLKLDKTKKTISVELSKKLKDSFFGEGCDIIKSKNGKDQIYQLTWKSRKIFKYKMDLTLLTDISLPSEIKEGWGITHDPENTKYAWISDGSSKLFKCDIEDNFKVVKQVEVSKNGDSVFYLNELEWIGKEIWANVYLSTVIDRIDPNTGKVIGSFDMAKLVIETKKLKQQRFNSRLDFGECLNGIAYDKNNDIVYITGKNWPTVYEMKIDDGNKPSVDV